MNQDPSNRPVSSAGYSRETTFIEMGRLAYASKWMILAATLTAAAAAAGASYLIRPLYRAEVLFVADVERQNSIGALALQFGNLAELAGLPIDVGGDRVAAIAVLRSRSLTEEFVREHDLLPILFDEEWDEALKTWKKADPKKAPTLWDAHRVFATKIRRIEEDRRTGLITLSIDWHDPDVAASWANELVQRANSKLQQSTISEAKKTISYLERELERGAIVEVRRMVFNLIEAETKKIAVASARTEYAFKVIDKAVAPRKRIKPQRAVIAVLGALAGAFLASLFALAKHPQR